DKPVPCHPEGTTSLPCRKGRVKRTNVKPKPNPARCILIQLPNDMSLGPSCKSLWHYPGGTHSGADVNFLWLSCLSCLPRHCANWPCFEIRLMSVFLVPKVVPGTPPRPRQSNAACIGYG